MMYMLDTSKDVSTDIRDHSWLEENISSGVICKCGQVIDLDDLVLSGVVLGKMPKYLFEFHRTMIFVDIGIAEIIKCYRHNVEFVSGFFGGAKVETHVGIFSRFSARSVLRGSIGSRYRVCRECKRGVLQLMGDPPKLSIVADSKGRDLDVYQDTSTNRLVVSDHLKGEVKKKFGSQIRSLSIEKVLCPPDGSQLPGDPNWSSKCPDFVARRCWEWF